MVVEDGRYTGDDRVLRLRSAQGSRDRRPGRGRGYDLADCYAYSDSITDLPMLEPSAIRTR